MSYRFRVCNVHGCGEIIEGDASRCVQHRREAERRRGSAADRGYTSKGHRQFRREVLSRDMTCKLCEIEIATEADHYPHSRKELIALGLNPNDPQYGRGLCQPCHARHTARAQPGGWNQARDIDR